MVMTRGLSLMSLHGGLQATDMRRLLRVLGEPGKIIFIRPPIEIAITDRNFVVTGWEQFEFLLL
jgi:hypothetical protein